MESKQVLGKRFFRTTKNSKLNYSLRIIGSTYEGDDYVAKDYGTNEVFMIKKKDLFLNYNSIRPHYSIAVNFISYLSPARTGITKDVAIICTQYPSDEFKLKLKSIMVDILGYYLKDDEYGTTFRKFLVTNENQLDGNCVPKIQGITVDEQEVAYGYIDDNPIFIAKEFLHLKIINSKYDNYWYSYKVQKLKDPLSILVELNFEKAAYEVNNIIDMTYKEFPKRYSSLIVFTKELDRAIKRVLINHDNPNRDIKKTLDIIKIMNAIQGKCIAPFDDIDISSITIKRYTSYVDLNNILANNPLYVITVLKFAHNEVIIMKYKALDSIKRAITTGKSPLDKDELEIFLKKKK